jgi:hypothetical protein
MREVEVDEEEYARDSDPHRLHERGGAPRARALSALDWKEMLPRGRSPSRGSTR